MITSTYIHVNLNIYRKMFWFIVIFFYHLFLSVAIWICEIIFFCFAGSLSIFLTPLIFVHFTHTTGISVQQTILILCFILFSSYDMCNIVINLCWTTSHILMSISLFLSCVFILKHCNTDSFDTEMYNFNYHTLPEQTINWIISEKNCT